jgi:hypothetical protein
MQKHPQSPVALGAGPPRDCPSLSVSPGAQARLLLYLREPDSPASTLRRASASAAASFAHAASALKGAVLSRCVRECRRCGHRIWSAHSAGPGRDCPAPQVKEEARALFACRGTRSETDSPVLVRPGGSAVPNGQPSPGQSRPGPARRQRRSQRTAQSWKVPSWSGPVAARFPTDCPSWTAPSRSPGRPASHDSSPGCPPPQDRDAQPGDLAPEKRTP